MDSFCFADTTLGHQCNREETFSKDVHNNNTYPFFSSTMRSLWNEVNVIVKYCKIGLRQFRVALKPSVPADSGFWILAVKRDAQHNQNISKREFEPGTPD